jgi:glycosyltransferase involved in cell wall biosynthesis
MPGRSCSSPFHYLRHVTSQPPYFSIVMASYLGHYEGNYGKAASDRIKKFRRAVQSCIDQTFQDWELLIVADGCEITLHEWAKVRDQRVRCLQIRKQRLWSERVRNAGIHKAQGRAVVYLDTDDMIGPDHLQGIHDALTAKGLDWSKEESPALWAYIDDQVWNAGAKCWDTRRADMKRRGGAGTSNIVHAAGQRIYWPVIEYRWPDNGYDHDRQFIRHLQGFGQGVRLEAGQYQVCHVPRSYDI